MESVHATYAMLLDLGLADHWPDILVAALIALLGYFGGNRFAAMDARHDKAERKFDKIDDCLGEHDTRITKVETVIQERRNRRSDVD